MAYIIELPDIRAMRLFLYAAAEELLRREGIPSQGVEMSRTLSPANPDEDADAIYALFSLDDRSYVSRQAHRATAQCLEGDYLELPDDRHAPLPLCLGQRLGDLYEGRLSATTQILSFEVPLLSIDGQLGTVSVQRGSMTATEDYRVTLRRRGAVWQASS